VTHPITPPPELVQQWRHSWLPSYGEFVDYVATQAAQWGADCELNACCEWLRSQHHSDTWPSRIRAARRPKPPSLKEQALEALETLNQAWIMPKELDAVITIRQALEALPND
jgi:hypothetical protein